MRRTARIGVTVLALLGVMSQVTRAQTNRLHIGPHIGYNFDVEELLVGAQFSVPVANRLELYPSFDYYFVEVGSLWAINADLKWRVARDRPKWLYVGAGLNITRSGVGSIHDTDAGLNLFTGVESLRGRIHPFAEGRLTIRDNTGFQLQGGLNITFGRH